MTRPGFRLPPHLRQLLQRQGVDLAALAEVAAAADPPRVGWKMGPAEALQWHRDTAEAVLAANVPRGYRTAAISDMDRRVRVEVTAWLRDHFADPEAYPWLLLAGLTGRGKSHLGWAVLKTVVRQAADRGRHPVFRFVNQESFNDELRIKPDNSHAYALRKYLDADWLYFDDIGAGRPTEFNTEGTLTVINHRYENRLPGIYTSNLGKSELTELMGSRVYSRLAESARIVIDGPDWRELQGWSAPR